MPKRKHRNHRNPVNRNAIQTGSIATPEMKERLTSHTVLPNDTLLVGFDFTHGADNRDNNVLIVGHKEGEYLQIINAFQGEEAERIFKLLTTVKNTEEKKEDQNK